ncbi:MAG TPA: GntR family transcriptional regulator [Azospirillum sp.]|nr:GntR family transcriptional regulator [Azospirillum sp.]
MSEAEHDRAGERDGEAAGLPERGETPRYQEIVRVLLDEIDAGVYAVGDRLPTEQELCARFTVSRHTVREALRRLQEMGYILRRQGSGSVLAARRAAGRFVNSISSLDELMQYAASTRLEILSVDRIIVEEELAARLGCRPETQWFRVSALRRTEATSEPFSYVEVYVDVAFADVVRTLDVVQYAIYTVLEQRYGIRIAEVMQDIEAAPADLNVASRLHIPPQSPILVVTRRYFTDDGRLVEIAVNAHPGADFRYAMTLQRR